MTVPTPSIKFFSLLTGLLLLLSACGEAGGSSMGPEEVAKNFLTAMGEGDFSGAKKYATKDSKQLLSTFESMAAMGGDPGGGPGGDFDIKDSKIDGDNATVTFEESGSTQDLRLVKENGEWKVAFSKNSLMDQAKDEGLDLSGNGDSESVLDTEEFNQAMDDLDAALDSLKEIGE